MKSGVSVLELIVGCAILAIVVLGGAYSLKPISDANRRFRLTNKAHRLEDEIRRGIFYQSNYNNPAGFMIEVNGVVLAREGETRYVNETLTASKTDATEAEKKSEFPLATKISLVPNIHMPTGWGLVYQVQSSDAQLQVATLGSTVFPENANEYVTNHHKTDHTIISVPEELATSVAKNCTAGIMRGIKKNAAGQYQAVCWEYAAPTTVPDWAIPTALTINDITNKVQLQYSVLNRPRCPEMNISNFQGKSWQIPNFYALKSIDMRDLFPVKAVGTSLASQCEIVIDFKKYDPAGIVPKALVDDATINKKPGFCPDKFLYVKQADGSCKMNFDEALVLKSVPAKVAP